MRPQLYISLIGATCALVVLAVGALASLLDTSALADVGVSAAAPTTAPMRPITILLEIIVIRASS